MKVRNTSRTLGSPSHDRRPAAAGPGGRHSVSLLRQSHAPGCNPMYSVRF